MISGMDRIVLSGLEFFARHGVFNEETVLGGRFLVDLEMFLPLSNVINLEDTVNYASVFEAVKLEMTEQNHALIESLANRIADRILHDHALVARVIVRVHKPHAPIAGVFRDVFVEVDRSR
jgi:7,8-dihydroneopterin aldolase/epimerase/oxygenase